MHEVGIMEGALDMARRLMEKRGGNRLRRVHMTIGSLSGVVPEALQSAFLALKDSYAAQDAALDVAWVEAVCRCDACRADFSFTEHAAIVGAPAKPHGFVGRGGAAERVSFAACGETNDTQLATTRQETFSGRTATESKMEGTHER